MWLGLLLGLCLRLLSHAGIRHRATFHGGSSILVGYWLCGVCCPGPSWLSIGRGQVRVPLRLLVSTLGSSFDSGRLLEGEVGAIVLGLGSVGPSL